MRIDKRTRAQATQLCALMASSNADVHGEYLIDFAFPLPPIHQVDFKEPCRVLGVDPIFSAAAELARQAYWAVPASSLRRAEWAEAEAMLRTGWLP
jgi:hypothetical protein